MKYILLIITVILINVSDTRLLAQEDSFIKDFLERWENSRNYLIEVAELMPEEQYNFKVTPESLSFAENLMHIGFAIDWHTQSLLGGRAARDYPTDTIYIL